MRHRDLDILSINHILFSSTENRGSLGKQLLLFSGQLLYYTFIHHFHYRKLPANYKGIVFLGFSTNNQRSLAPIIRNMVEGEYLYLDNHKDDLNKRKAWWISIAYFFTTMRVYRKSDAPTRKRFKRFFADFWTTYGLYQVAEDCLIHYKVKTLVLSNDHNTFHRCLILNAQKLGIKTIYVQHASVTPRFPRLLFDYSFLDGEETLEKYLCAGQPNGKVFLSGGVRFDSFPQKQRPKPNATAQTIGIAINMLDDFERVKSLCMFLLHHKFQIILRPHPRYGSLDLHWMTENGILFSDPGKESSSDFIKHIDCMISNQSAIHLDAAIMNCPCVLFNFSSQDVNDYYAFIRNGLVTEAHNFEELKLMLSDMQQLLPTDATLRYYNANSNTPLYGHLGEAIATCLHSINSGDCHEAIFSDYFHNDGRRPFVFLINGQ